MRRSVITDEVSQRLDEVFAFAARFSLEAVELRSVEGLGPFEYTDALVREVAARLRGEGRACCCLSLPLFKCDLRDRAARAAQTEGLKRALAHANALSCSLVRGFCFWRTAGEALPMGEIVDAYGEIIPLLADAGVAAALEADPSVWGATAAELAQILAAIDSPSARAIWDGGNLLFVPGGEAPPAGYEILRPWIAHVHIKDAVRAPDGVRAVCVGTGEAQIAAQLSLLMRDGYAGCLSLETHYRLRGALDEAQLRLPGGDAFSAGGLEASEESMRALDRLLMEVQGA